MKAGTMGGMTTTAGRRRPARAWLAALLVIAAAGCGRSGDKADTKSSAGGQTQGEQQVTAGARQVAEGAKQMARGVQQMVQAAAKPVEFEELKALLPDIDGWKRTDAAGEMISIPVPYSEATARYTRGDSQVDLEIKDTALSQVVLGPYTMFMTSGFAEKSDDGYKKAVTVAGSPGFEEWNQPAQTAELTVVVAGRFVVRGKGKHVANADPVRAVVQAVNAQKLAKLK